MDTSTHIQDTENTNDNIEDDEGEDERPQWEVRSWLRTYSSCLLMLCISTNPHRLCPLPPDRLFLLILMALFFHFGLLTCHNP